MGRVFANGPRDQSSIPGRVIPKTFKKWYLIPHCLTLSIIRYVSRVKWSNAGKGVAPSPTPQCSSYWKGTLWVTFDYSRKLYFYFHLEKRAVDSLSLLLDLKLNPIFWTSLMSTRNWRNKVLRILSNKVKICIISQIVRSPMGVEHSGEGIVGRP